MSKKHFVPFTIFIILLGLCLSSCFDNYEVFEKNKIYINKLCLIDGYVLLISKNTREITYFIEFNDGTRKIQKTTFLTTSIEIYNEGSPIEKLVYVKKYQKNKDGSVSPYFWEPEEKFIERIFVVSEKLILYY